MKSVIKLCGWLFMVSTTAGFTMTNRQDGETAVAAWRRLIDRATTLFDQGQFDPAIQHTREALRLADSESNPDDERIVTSLLTLASLLMQTDKIEDAAPLAERALHLAEQIRHFANALTNLAAVHLDEGRVDSALDLYARGLSIQEAAFGQENPRLVNLLKNMAAARRRLGQTAEAAEVKERIAQLSNKSHQQENQES